MLSQRNKPGRFNLCDRASVGFRWIEPLRGGASRQNVITARSARFAANRTPTNPGCTRNIGSDFSRAKRWYSAARLVDLGAPDTGDHHEYVLRSQGSLLRTRRSSRLSSGCGSRGHESGLQVPGRRCDSRVDHMGVRSQRGVVFAVRLSTKVRGRCGDSDPFPPQRQRDEPGCSRGGGDDERQLPRSAIELRGPPPVPPLLRSISPKNR